MIEDRFVHQSPFEYEYEYRFTEYEYDEDRIAFMPEQLITSPTGGNKGLSVGLYQLTTSRLRSNLLGGLEPRRSFLEKLLPNHQRYTYTHCVHLQSYTAISGLVLRIYSPHLE